MPILHFNQLPESDETKRHQYWMHQALLQAQQALLQAEVPVGAILVKDDRMIGCGFNQPISAHDPSAHAEMLAIRSAANQIHNYRLTETTLYVTLEPCTMCWGLLLHARVNTLVFGARESKSGVFSQLQLQHATCYNHQITIIEGVFSDLASDLMTTFFTHRRAERKSC